MKTSTQLNALADKKNFALVYLQAEEKISGKTAWNLEHGSLTAKLNNYDDLNYFKKVKSQVDLIATLDKSKEYIIGHSEGGGAAQYIASSLPGVFAGVGGIKSTRLSGDPLPSKDDPMAAVFVFGQNDPVLPLRGGTDILPLALAAPNILDSRPQRQMDVYAKANECHGRSMKDSSVDRSISHNCAQAPLGEIFQYNTGHSWDNQLGTSKKVVDFLLKFTKPAPVTSPELAQKQ
jgi:poly(3-hydroxybutyrate) depolymerase